MHILLANDDGIHAAGIRTLAQALRQVADVTVVAPDRNRSGASHSLTLGRPLRLTEVGPGEYTVDGTPTDCVHLGLTALLADNPPDIVVSGINHGANMGDDVLYSGTVAAAMEGRFLGLPAIAVSCAHHSPAHFSTAAAMTLRLLEQLHQHPLPPQTILNLNVGDVPLERIRGFAVTRLGHRHVAEGVIQATDPRGRPIYWIGPAGPEQDAGEGTDFHAVANDYASVTPLHSDFTRRDCLAELGQWLREGQSAGSAQA
ncbi:MAG: 5'/3'-nucleotidase SurE [Oceanococcaceae bacterium]